jgi:hypothetical protein
LRNYSTGHAGDDDDDNEDDEWMPSEAMKKR